MSEPIKKHSKKKYHASEEQKKRNTDESSSKKNETSSDNASNKDKTPKKKKQEKQKRYPVSGEFKVRSTKVVQTASPAEPFMQQLKKWLEVERGLDQTNDEVLRPLIAQRLTWAKYLFVFCLSILAFRAAYLMLLPQPDIEYLSRVQTKENHTIHGRRGDILDRNGHILASTVSLRKVVVSPLHIPDEHIELVVDVLVKYIPELDKDKTVARIQAKKKIDSQYLVIAQRVTPLTYTKIKEEIQAIYAAGDSDFKKSFKDVKNRALSIEKDHYRYYTGKEDASPLLGGILSASQRGAGGIEYLYDQVLRGGEFVTLRYRDAQDREIMQLTPDEMAPKAQDGNSLVLTIDSRIQHVADNALATAVEETKAQYGMAVVIDVHTGEVLASSTKNPNTQTNINSNSVFANPQALTHHAMIDVYEAGSVLKPLIVAAGVNEGLYKPSSMIDCMGGFWRIHGANIRDDHPQKVISLTEVLQHSSNIGAAQVMLALGKDTGVQYLSDFGLGKETGLNFPGEPKGTLRSAKNTKPIELITMSYGYGLTTNLTQLAIAYASFGNGGKIMKPLLVREIQNAHGDTIERYEPTEITQVISAQTAKDMMGMLEKVVTDGTAKKAQIPGYSVAGKTGTAKKASNGAYSATDRIGSFIGLVPADNPRLVIAISIDTPSEGLAYGGLVAAPAFAEIAKASMEILGVPPDPSIMPTKDEEAIIYDSAPPIPEMVWTDDGEIIIPDLTGLTLRDAVSTLQTANLQITIEGSGRVTTQLPRPGSYVQPMESVRVVLR